MEGKRGKTVEGKGGWRKGQRRRYKKTTKREGR